jgi:hypothetical protein
MNHSVLIAMAAKNRARDKGPFQFPEQSRDASDSALNQSSMKKPAVLAGCGLSNLVLVLLPTASSGGCGLFF